MSTKKTEVTKSQKNIKRMFTLTKILMCVIPFMMLFYMYVQSSQNSVGYNEILRSNPVLTVAFLTAMCQPFAAWLLTIVERRVESMEYSNAFVGLLLIFIAECMFKNWLGIASTAILFYLINKDSPYTLSEEFKKYADWKSIFKDATGEIVLLILAAFCLFCSYQIG